MATRTISMPETVPETAIPGSGGVRWLVCEALWPPSGLKVTVRCGVNK